MKKTKTYHGVFFLPEHIEEIAGSFRRQIGDKESEKLRLLSYVQLPGVKWEHDQESELFSDIRKEGAEYKYQLFAGPYGYDLEIWGAERYAAVCVTAKSRADIEAVYQIIEKLTPQASRPIVAQNPVSVFIGHGGDKQWRDLKDHLHDKHHYSVQAYEIGERSGHTIRDILEEMLGSSSIAFLVMTGEDEMAGQQLRARQNVIHEIGLFQGRLGFTKGIILLEEGVEEFSNMKGVHQIRFKKNSIRETFGDVIATIKREFQEV